MVRASVERRLWRGATAATAAIVIAFAVAGCGRGGGLPVAASGTDPIRPSTITVPTTVTVPATDSGGGIADSGTEGPASTAPPETNPGSVAPDNTAGTTPAPTTTTIEELTLTGTGVVGRVTAGPTCPVERPDQPCPPSPVQGRLDAIDSAGHTAGSATTDDLGRFAIALAPGGYTLRVVIDGPFPHCPDTAVTVTGGPPVTADIDCDTGIR